jgi:hypothetical protein
MMAKELLKLASFLIVSAAITGCASTRLTEYQPDHSKAWNLTHAAGMKQLDDAEVPEDQLPSKLGAAVSSGIDVAYFMNSATLNMNFADSLGLGLVGLLTKPAAESERRTMLVWVPATDINQKSEAHTWVSRAFRDATIQAMDDLGIEGGVDYFEKDESSIFSDVYETKLSGVSAEGIHCQAVYRVIPEFTDKEKMPSFVGAGGYGYLLKTDDDIYYPKARIACWGSKTLAPYVRFASEISKNLPPTAYLYTPYLRTKDGESQVPPMVHDHGKALLFVVSENQGN